MGGGRRGEEGRGGGRRERGKRRGERGGRRGEREEGVRRGRKSWEMEKGKGGNTAVPLSGISK